MFSNEILAVPGPGTATVINGSTYNCNCDGMGWWMFKLSILPNTNWNTQGITYQFLSETGAWYPHTTMCCVSGDLIVEGGMQVTSPACLHPMLGQPGLSCLSRRAINMLCWDRQVAHTDYCRVCSQPVSASHPSPWRPKPGQHWALCTELLWRIRNNWQWKLNWTN